VPSCVVELPRGAANRTLAEALLQMVDAHGCRLMGATILVAEDEAIVATDLAHWLRDEGAKVVVSTNLRDSLAKADLPDLTIGIVDHRFGQQTSEQVCAKLDARGIPFIVYTAVSDIPTACKHGVIVRKPARVATLLDALVGMLRKNVSDQA
jgi:DNA-binding NtrC family response regulator